MNKKLFLKLLLLLLLSMSLVACRQKNNSAGEDTSSKLSTSNVQSSVKESVKTASSSAENTVKSKQEDKDTSSDVKKNSNASKANDAPEQFIMAGGANKVPGLCEYIVSPEINPSIITQNPLFNDSVNNDINYMDVVLNIFNTSNEAKMSKDAITAKIKIKDKEYSCFSLIENIDGSNFDEATSVNPQETRMIHYIAKVPKFEAGLTNYEIILTINGKDYSNKFIYEQGLTEEEYYNLIKEAKQQRQDYINSSVDPKVKESLDTPLVAAISKATSLSEQYPEDTDTIDVALKRLLEDEKPLPEDEYYRMIKQAKQLEENYIDSISDPHVKQSVQTSFSAAIAESSSLYLQYPKDMATINAALKRVLNGE